MTRRGLLAGGAAGPCCLATSAPNDVAKPDAWAEPQTALPADPGHRAVAADRPAGTATSAPKVGGGSRRQAALRRLGLAGFHYPRLRRRSPRSQPRQSGTARSARLP